MHTWNELGLDQPCRFSFRSFAVPKYVNSLNAGHHFLNSTSQFNITDVGTTMRCGPHMPWLHARYASNEMVWMVFPKPISSARIPLRALS